MSHCSICGDSDREDAPLSHVLRYWDPDEGYKAGRLCHYCRPEAKRKPAPTDYAYDRRREVFSDEDEAISQIYG